jgi:predicted transcriptional regulator
MPRKKSQTLTDSELRIMDVLWDKGQGSVKDVTEILAGSDQPVAYNTVLTMLRILHEKGYVNYLKEGRAFIYTPVVAREQARSKAARHLIRRFFDGSPSLLVQNLLEGEEIPPEELARLKRLVAEDGEEEG